MFLSQVRYVREDSEEADLLSQLLLDEPEEVAAPPLVTVSNGGGEIPVGGDGHSTFGLQQFLDHVKEEVALHLAPVEQ